MKKMFMLIGYKEVPIVDANNPENTHYYVVGTLIENHSNINHAEKVAAEEAKNYELGVEIKTVYVKD